MTGAHVGLLALAAAILWPRSKGVGPVTKGPRAGQSEDVEALARLFVSEDEGKSHLWPAFARTAENTARARNTTLTRLLKTEVIRGVTTHSDSWGMQYDESRGAKRWAGTSKPATGVSLAFAERYLADELTVAERAQRDAVGKATSFLEAAEGSALAVEKEADWGKPLLYSADGWRFYG